MRSSYEQAELDAIAQRFLERRPGAAERVVTLLREDLAVVVRRTLGRDHPAWPDAHCEALAAIATADPAKIRFGQSGQLAWARVENWAKCIARRAAIAHIRAESRRNREVAFDEQLDSHDADDPILKWEDQELDGKASLDAALRQLTADQRSLVVLMMTKRAKAEAVGEKFSTVAAIREIAEMLGRKESDVRFTYYAARRAILRWIPAYFGMADPPVPR